MATGSWLIRGRTLVDVKAGKVIADVRLDGGRSGALGAVPQPRMGTVTAREATSVCT